LKVEHAHSRPRGGRQAGTKSHSRRKALSAAIAKGRRRVLENVGQAGNIARSGFHLKDGQKNFIIGLDECICDASGVKTEKQALEAKEVQGAREWVNGLMKNEHYVCLFSERPERLRRATERWLREHGFMYTSLILGKPTAQNYHYIDDRHVQATTFKGRYTELVRKEHRIEVFG